MTSHTATLLPDGKVLLVTPRNAEIYDAVTGTWTAAGNFNSYGSSSIPTATLLSDRRVLIYGFINEGDGIEPPRLYDAAKGSWRYIGDLTNSRSDHTATLLPNGRVLVAGGVRYYESTLNSAELFDPGLPQTGTIISASAASFSLTGVSSEAIVSGFGSDLATITSGATTIPLPTSLAGTTVKVKDSVGAERLAPLFFVSPTQVNYQIPSETATGAATISITNGNGEVSTGLILIKSVTPGLFAANANGHGVAAALALRVHTDGSRSYEPIAQFDAAKNEFIARPLDLGPESEHVYLVLFGTGYSTSQFTFDRDHHHRGHICRSQLCRCARRLCRCGPSQCACSAKTGWARRGRSIADSRRADGERRGHPDQMKVIHWGAGFEPCELTS